jgi:hypothetical protein
VTVPSLRTIEMLAKALGVAPHVLVREAENAAEKKPQAQR